MTSPDALVRDMVFPIIHAKKVDGGIEMVSFLGTGFLVGSKGYALTAAHVMEVDKVKDHAVVGMFVQKETGKWTVWNADLCDVHPSEDVALLKMRNDHWEEAAFKVSFEKQFSAFEYKLFGYPYANLYEDADARAPDGRVLGRPDLIYSAGHIRRRTNFSLPGIRGRCFYELSQPVGSGCSGSPIFTVRGRSWEVVGIYVADKSESVSFYKLNENLDQELETIEFPGALAYAVRLDDLSDWKPKVLNDHLDQIP